MGAIIVYHRQFEFAVERCGHYRLPIHPASKPHTFRFGSDSDQKSLGLVRHDIGCFSWIAAVGQRSHLEIGHHGQTHGYQRLVRFG